MVKKRSRPYESLREKEKSFSRSIGDGMKIAIDGPAGSGKSTIAKKLSAKLNFDYLDTGALYRGVTYLIEKNGLNLDQEKEIQELLDSVHFHFEGNKLYLDGALIENEIRKNSISNLVSHVASKGFIRRNLTRIEQEIASKTANVILDGRDIGTVVLPEAELKIYLDASPAVRAKRRHRELVDRGELVDAKRLLDEIIARDSLDMKRLEGPLVVAKDAFVVTTDDLSIEEVVDRIMEMVNSTI